MPDKALFETLFHQNGFDDFKWIEADVISVRNWVRMKCMYGCKDYGQNASCPPNVPPVSECREFVKEYEQIAIFHFSIVLDKPEKRYALTCDINKQLLSLERDVFWKGFHKTFLLFLDSCTLCKHCSETREGCRNKADSRPTPEALGIDVFETVRKIGYPIQVLTDYDQPMNRYAFLFIE